MSFYQTEEERLKLIARLNRIDGQLRGINKMINDERSCIEILTQVTSIQAALKGLCKEIVRGHLQNCVKNSLKSAKDAEALINELVEHLDKLK